MDGDTMQVQMAQMAQMMAGNPMSMNLGTRNNNFFMFVGNSMSLQARIDSLTP